jgi:hypothetical protein
VGVAAALKHGLGLRAACQVILALREIEELFAAASKFLLQMFSDKTGSASNKNHFYILLFNMNIQQLYYIVTAFGW